MLSPLSNAEVPVDSDGAGTDPSLRFRSDDDGLVIAVGIFCERNNQRTRSRSVEKSQEAHRTEQPPIIDRSEQLRQRPHSTIANPSIGKE